MLGCFGFGYGNDGYKGHNGLNKVSLMEVTEDDDGSRLDKWLSRRFPNLGHNLVQKLLRTGQIRVDGARASGGRRLVPGQQVRIPPLHQEPLSEKPQPEKLNAKARELQSRVLFEDEELIALDKPSGLAVQGGTKQNYYIDNLSHGLVGKGQPLPRLVHRLDKDTSGVLLLAKSAAAARDLTAAFKSNRVQKTYWAVVKGVPRPKRGHIQNRLGKTRQLNGERVTADEVTGRFASTRYEVLDSSARKFSLLGLYPLTGRTHQLRVHCANLGTPILGDKKYGNNDAEGGLESIQGLQLHAKKLVLLKNDGLEIEIEAPLPIHIRKCLSTLGLSMPI